MAGLKVGDIVILKSDNLPHRKKLYMTVKSISENEVTCLWRINNSSFKERIFHENMLSRVEIVQDKFGMISF